jgi:hypothetical protein
MGKIIADDTPMLVLSGVVEPVEIRDEGGKLLGVFVPANIEQTRQAYAKLASRIDRAEIERRKKLAHKGYTTKEVFEHLKALTEDEAMRLHLQKLIDQLVEREACATP